MNMKLLLSASVALVIGLFAGNYWTSRKIEAMTSSPAPVPAASAPLAEAQTSTSSVQTCPGPEASEVEEIIAGKDKQIAELQEQLKSADTPKETLAPEADNAEYRQKLAAEILELTDSKEQIRAAFEASAKTMLKDKSPEHQKAYEEILQKYFGWEVLEPFFTKTYTEVFSAQELSDLADFYRSDVGTTMVRKQPEVTAKTMELMMKLNKERMPQIMKEMQNLEKPAAKAETPKAAAAL